MPIDTEIAEPNHVAERCPDVRDWTVHHLGDLQHQRAKVDLSLATKICLHSVSGYTIGIYLRMKHRQHAQVCHLSITRQNARLMSYEGPPSRLTQLIDRGIPDMIGVT